MIAIGEMRTLGVEQSSPRRTALLATLGIWIAGLALAGATAWRMQHPTVYGANETVTATRPEASADTDNGEADGVLLMPADSLVGQRSSKTGVTLMQTPEAH